jgi:hypothetical protein
LFDQFATVGQDQCLFRNPLRALYAIDEASEDDLRLESVSRMANRSCTYSFAAAGSQRNAQAFVTAINVGDDRLNAFLLILP